MASVKVHIDKLYVYKARFYYILLYDLYDLIIDK